MYFPINNNNPYDPKYTPFVIFVKENNAIIIIDIKLSVSFSLQETFTSFWFKFLKKPQLLS